MSVTRKTIAHDLNAIANAVTRGEDLNGIAEEIAIVIENMDQVNAEEKPDENTGTKPEADNKEDAGGCSCQG